MKSLKSKPIPPPSLNWAEIALWVERLAPAVTGLRCERVFMPERLWATDAGAILKGEWALKLSGPGRDCHLLMSVRPRWPYLAYYPTAALKPCVSATRSAFMDALNKSVRGRRLTSLEHVPRERVVVLWFGEVGLALSLIPATPEAILIASGEGAERPVLARSREKSETYRFPDGAGAPVDPAVRKEWFESLETYGKIVEAALRAEGGQRRIERVASALRDRVKHLEKALKESEASIAHARAEPDWARYGELLKADPSANDRKESRITGVSVREVTDYETGARVSVPCDPKLSLRAQIEKFFHQAKRKQRRFTEAEERNRLAREDLDALRDGVGNPESLERDALERAERILGLKTVIAAGTPDARAKRPRVAPPTGRAFESKDGFPIWVGRSRDENLEITFKNAKGNDLWLHLKGKPGAHVIVPVPAGKSVPLETLLDAATLTIYYSGGEKWGKTEVDYTFRKNVRRIKDSKEVSYTGNKTLCVEVDPVRLKRLLNQ